MRVKHAGEIMIPLEKYPHIPYWYSLRQATAEMDKLEMESHRGLCQPRVVLIFDEQKRLLGVIRRQDILQALEPETLMTRLLNYRRRLLGKRSEKEATEEASERLVKNIRERAERPLSDVMLPIKYTVDFDDSIIRAVFQMIEGNLVLLPVLKGGKVVGVVEIVDVFHEIAELLQDPESH